MEVLSREVTPQTSVLPSYLYYKSFQICLPQSLSFPDGLAVKNLPAVQELWIQSLGQEDPPHPGVGNGNVASVFLPGKSYEQRSLVGCSPQSRK